MAKQSYYGGKGIRAPQREAIMAAYESLAAEDQAEIDAIGAELAEGIKQAAMEHGGKRPQVGPETTREILGAIAIRLARREAK